MGPSQICGCPFREPRVFEIAHLTINIGFKWFWHNQKTGDTDVEIIGKVRGNYVKADSFGELYVESGGSQITHIFSSL